MCFYSVNIIEYDIASKVINIPKWTTIDTPLSRLAPSLNQKYYTWAVFLLRALAKIMNIY